MPPLYQQVVIVKNKFLCMLNFMNSITKSLITHYEMTPYHWMLPLLEKLLQTC